MHPQIKKIKMLAFTLIEIMVTMSIISLLSSVVFSATKSAKNKAVDSATESQGGQFRTALALYKNDTGSYPKATGSQILSLSGRDFNVACLGTGCILNDQPVDPLASGTLTKYIDDTQATIAPQIIADGKIQKGIFLVTCKDSTVCGDEAYIMSTVTKPADSSCIGPCVLSGSGGSLILSNTTKDSIVVGGTCSDPAYNTTSQAVCEIHGECLQYTSATTMDECGTCNVGNPGEYYSTKTSCEAAGYCTPYVDPRGFGLPLLTTQSLCEDVSHGYCDTGQASNQWPYMTQNACTSICTINGQVNPSDQYGNWDAYLHPGYLDEPSCTSNSACIEDATGYLVRTADQSECTPELGRSLKNNIWESTGYQWMSRTWHPWTWYPGAWTPATWTPPQQ